ncbi:DNA polymerase III subunit gamma/tau [Candidatus Endowatersipora endosymbiont of Watersipora subatra]|uniref:DNA polymerase III subunit gamma/tau n=1 Tax=Candidatus Endowatersipora endosymbiont of Watersipora subatra TaxID=3077946 RepID=UPI00312CA994
MPYTSNYLILARKYRPLSFDNLIGQEPMVLTLSNAFKTGRLAQAYMLTGVRGVGKTTTARILARALNYETPTIRRPTLNFSEFGIHCESILEGTHVDVIEMDAASHTGISDIREILASARYKPVSARYKIYIIDEVHMLSTAAFNGLLKTLEEPPERMRFILATTEIRKIPMTVLSRCQRFDLRRIDTDELIKYLDRIAKREGIDVEQEALAMIARASDGSVRDALSILDQGIAYASGCSIRKLLSVDIRSMLGLADRSSIIDLFEHVMKGEIRKALNELKSQYDLGADPATVLSDLADFTHLITRLRYVESALDERSLSKEEKKRVQGFANQLTPRILDRAWQILLKGILEVESAPRPIAAADMVLVRLTHAADLPTPDELLKKISKNHDRLLSSPSMKEEGISNNKTPIPSLGERPQLVVRNDQAFNENIDSFYDLLKIAERKRDIRFKLMMRNNFSEISFENGKIEFSIVGDAPPDMLKIMHTKLYDWTGKLWEIRVSESKGHTTIKQREEIHSEKILKEAARNPVVSAILALFPESKIIDTRFCDEKKMSLAT